jgi:Bacterial transcriptional activator domain
LLQGFFVAGAPGFERWLDDERHQIRDALRSAAWARAVRQLEGGDPAGAATTARRADALAPEDEQGLGRLMDVLVAAGERTAAVQLYDEFAARLSEEYGMHPSVETVAGAGAIRTSAPAPADTELSDPTAREARQQATALGATLPDRYRADTAHFPRYFRAEEILDRGYVSEARDSMRRLTEDAPFYAPAWTGYASALSLSGFADIPPRQALPQSLAAAERGLALDSTLLEGAVVLIAYDMFGRWDLDAAKAKLDAALARAPDDPALNNVFAAWYRWRGDLANAVAVKQRAASLQPLSNWLNEQVAWNLYLSHRCAEVAKLYEQLANEGRMLIDTDLQIFHTYKCMGRLDDAAAALRTSLLRMGDSVLARLLEPPLDSARREAAFHAVARARLTRYLAARRKRWLPSETAVFDYADLGDADSTLIWLDSMWVERSMHLHIVPFDPALDFLRSDPRFRAFIRRLPWKPSLAAASGAPR